MYNEIQKLNKNLTEYRNLILEKDNHLEQLGTENKRLSANFDAFYNKAETEYNKLTVLIKKNTENCRHLYDEKYYNFTFSFKFYLKLNFFFF